MHVTTRDDVLIAGSTTEHPRSSDVEIEFSFDWIEPEFDTIAKRHHDPFYISEESKKKLREIAEYWKGRTISEYAMSLMSKDCQDNAAFKLMENKK